MPKLHTHHDGYAGRIAGDRREDHIPLVFPIGAARGDPRVVRALVRDRPLLLLDEPFAALDPGLRRDMIALVDALRRERGATVLLSLHTPADMIGHADLAAFIAEGRAILVDSPERALAGGLDPRLDAYLGLT